MSGYRGNLLSSLGMAQQPMQAPSMTGGPMQAPMAPGTPAPYGGINIADLLAQRPGMQSIPWQWPVQWGGATMGQPQQGAPDMTGAMAYSRLFGG